MIRVDVLVDEQARAVGFDARGHALFGDYGQDIVCAAVSALLQTALLGLEQCAQVAPTWTCKPGRLRCVIPVPHRDDAAAQVLLASILRGLQAMDEQYPGYIRIEEKRLPSRTRVRAARSAASLPRT